MEERYIKCFMESALKTLPMFLGKDNLPTGLNVETLQSLPQGFTMHIIVGITGDMFGNLILSISEESSLRLASAMMGCEILDRHSEISFSAIKEIINICAGGGATRLYELGKQIDVTPPTIITGDSVNVQLTFPLECITFILKEFDFHISISLQERKPRSVLIVDDSQLLRNSATNVLQMAGFRVVGSCDSGEQCLAYLEKLVPDIVLLDIEMPGMSGIDVLKHIRARAIPTKVVIFTVVGNEATVQKATALGVDGYMLKPLSVGLLRVLKNL